MTPSDPSDELNPEADTSSDVAEIEAVTSEASPEADASDEDSGDSTETQVDAPDLPPAAPVAESSKGAAAEAQSKFASPLDDHATGLMDWYILKVAFNREDSIADGLRKRVKMEGMEEFFGDIVVPTEDVATFTRDGKRRISKRKLLPGYVMARMIINDDTWFLVRETAGISDFTGSAGKPMPMEPEDVERFINRPVAEDDEEAPIKTAIPFKVGDRVRVKEGNFENQEGEVDGVDETHGNVTVIINIFGRSVPMELKHWQVEPL